MKNLTNADFNLNVESITKDTNGNIQWTGYGCYFGSDGMEYDIGEGQHSANDFVFLNTGHRENYNCTNLLNEYLKS